jgi:hypothetical protein
MISFLYFLQKRDDLLKEFHDDNVKTDRKATIVDSLFTLDSTH